jgi:hypothetical protein
MENEIETVRFAVVVDGEVISGVTHPNVPPHDAAIAAMRSGITFIEVPEEVPVGSKWDGKKFTPPVE